MELLHLGQIDAVDSESTQNLRKATMTETLISYNLTSWVISLTRRGQIGILRLLVL